VHGRLTLVLTLLCGAAPVVAAPPTFSTQVVITPDAWICMDVKTEDVDQDGDLDIVTASYEGMIAWYENDGATPPGPWTRHVVTTFADGALSVFTARLDGDADLDFLTGTFNTNEVMWFENGSLPDPWEKHLISFDAPFVDDVWAADLDDDGDTDAIASYNPTIAWYESDGASTPQFHSEHVLTLGSGAEAVQSVDLDEDGDIDVVAAAWYENDGAPDPSFTTRMVATGPHGAVQSVFVKDVDRDGDLDILWAEDNRISWHENDGGAPPAWTHHVVSTTAQFAMDVYANDLDGDTDLDILSASFDDDKIAWYESDGGSPPSFVERVITTVAWGARAVHAADLDGDGDVDVLSGTQRDHDLVWYVNELNYADTDGDGMRDDLDCAPGNATAFAPAGEIRDLRFDAVGQPTWGTEAHRSGSGTVYDVLQGRIDQMPVGSGSGETCMVTAATSLPAGPAPAPDAGVYYLVRGKNACGVGTFGFTSEGLERTTTACP